MSKRLAYLCVLPLLVSTGGFAEEAPVTDCDKYAAVSIDKVNPTLFVAACENALRKYPSSARLTYLLGRAYQKANNFAGAVEQYRKAADQNYAVAQNSLGIMYVNGQGIAKNEAQAVALFRKAADQGLAPAQNNLAVMYQNGQGVPQDFQEAMIWYRMAAVQGWAGAQSGLAFMYANGIGTPKDFLRAHIWWNIAAKAGFTTAGEDRDAISKMMTKEQIAEAQAMARKCETSKFKQCDPGSAESTEEAALIQKIIQLTQQKRYSEATILAKRVLAAREKTLGADNPDVADALNNVAWLYRAQNRFGDAEPLYKRSFAIFERVHNYPNLASVATDLTAIYKSQGRYSEATALLQRVLAIQEKAFGPNHPEVADSLNNLATLYGAQGRYADAESLYKRSLAIREKALGPDHPDFAASLRNLGVLYYENERYAEAEHLYKRALAIREKALGPDHPEVANSLNDLAALYEAQARYAETEPLFKRALAIREKVLGSDHPDLGQSLNNLAVIYEDLGRYDDAEPLYKRSLKIEEKAYGPDHPEVAGALNNLANLYKHQARYADAEPLIKRSLAIYEKALGPDHVSMPLDNLAGLYTAQGRYAEAEPLYQRSLAISEKDLGPDNSDVGRSLSHLADLYRYQARYADAEPLARRSLAIKEKALGPDHPSIAASLNSLAALYYENKRYTDAEPLFKRALAIQEKSVGPDHPNVATSLNALAALYEAQGRYAEAEPLFKRSLAIEEKALGPDHPDVLTFLNNLALLYQHQNRYADALAIVQRTISQTHARKSVALGVIYGAQLQNIIAPMQALNLSYTVLQHSASSAAGEAISKLAARFAAGTSELAQLVRKDQDLAAEADRLDKSIIAAVSKPLAQRNTAIEDQSRKRIDQIKSERDTLQNAFNQRFPDYVALSKPQPLTIEQTQASLSDDEALVTVDLHKTSYVWVISKDRAEWKELTVSAEDVSEEVKTLRTGLNPEHPRPFDRNLAYQLYRQVLGPIEDIIAQKTRLSFVVDGALTSLPPQVLITSDPDGKDLASLDWLVRKYAVTILPSVASLKVLRGEKSVIAAINPMIGYGNPVFDRTTQIAGRPKVAALNRSLSSFYRGLTADTNSLAQALPALPETADELRAIAKMLGAKREDIKLGEAASVTAIKRQPLDKYRVVYFATHALVAGEVEKFAKVKAEPALVLSIPDKPTEEDDGLLRASEVATLKLNADFVVLSACNTAAGDKPGAEALSGLARAFFYAGAKSLVVSNWQVDGEATVVLMDGLFEALKANPHLSHAEALRLSMLKMIANSSKPEWAQPQYWAPFVVVGEPQKR